MVKTFNTTPIMRNIVEHIPSLFFLVVVWIIAIILVNPIGDFPLNDDFSYGRTVYNLTELDLFLFDDWLGMSLIAQVLWGAVFTKVFGFSFTVLRFSTLVLAYIGLSFFYLLMRDMGGKRNLSLLASLSIAFSPLFFSLSFTFMTDIPFFSFMVLSVYFFNKFLRNEKLLNLSLAIIFTVLAILIRQLGFMLAIAFLLTWLIRSINQPQSRTVRDFIIAIFPLLVSVFAYFLFKKWFVSIQDLPENYDSIARLTKRLNKDFWLGSMERIGMLISYIGIFLLSVLLSVGPFRFWKKKEGDTSQFTFLEKKIIAGFSLFFIACLLVGLSHIFWGNILNGLTLGPSLLKDGQHFSNIPKFTNTQVQVMKVLFFAGGVLFTLQILPATFRSLKKENSRFLVALFAAMNILVYGGFLMLETLFFDRYLIQLLPFVLILIFAADTKWSKKYSVLACFVLFCMSLYSIAGTHDYLAWHRAKKQALEHLTERMEIPKNEIDGGFEFNGWHRKAGQKKWLGGKSPWWVEKDYYAITFGDVKGYKRVKAFPFQRWLPPMKDSIFIMEVKYR